MDLIMQWGIGVTLGVQGNGALQGLMEFFTFLGREEFFLLVMPALYWCLDAALGARLAVVLVASESANGLLKQLFHLPRPYWFDSRVTALSVEGSYGLPSGHAQDAAAVWGFLASQAKRNWAWPAAIVAIVLISLSRVYLGVHFISDVLGGLIVGGLLLWAFLRWERRLGAWWGRFRIGGQIGLALALSLLYLLLNAGTLALIASTPDPEVWAQTAAIAAPPADGEPAIDPRNPEGGATRAGMIFGAGAGLALASRYACFSARGPWGKRAARFALGLVGVLAIWMGLRYVFPSGTDLVGLTFRYLRYALAVFWVLYLAPWAFLRIGWADRA